MSISLEQLSAQMRRGEQVPLRHTMQVVLTLSIPSILQQIVVTAVEYIDAAMVGHIGASATASIGIVSSSTWLMHGMLAGLYMSFAIQVAQYLGADRQDDARGVLRQSMIFNLVVGLAAAAFGIGISRFLPGWLGADPSLQADASAYFAIWSASLPFLMIMGTYSSMLRSSGDALTPGLISVLTCVLDVIFNFCLINPTREMVVFGRTMTVWGLAGGTGRSTGHRPCYRYQRCADPCHPAAAGRPAVHPQARLLAHYQSLPAEPVEGRRTAGRRACSSFLGAGAAHPHRIRPWHHRHCCQQSGCERRKPVLHGRLWHSGCIPCTGGAGRGRKPSGYGKKSLPGCAPAWA